MPDRITKFIDSLNEKTRRQLKAKLLALKKSPFSTKGVKKMQGGENIFRLRMGKIRIIYRIVSNNDIEVVDIDYRGNIY